MMIPQDVLLLYSIVLGILGILFFHMKSSIVISRTVKYSVGVLMGIALNLQIAFGIMTILYVTATESSDFSYWNKPSVIVLDSRFLNSIIDDSVQQKKKI